MGIWSRPKSLVPLMGQHQSPFIHSLPQKQETRSCVTWIMARERGGPGPSQGAITLQLWPKRPSVRSNAITWLLSTAQSLRETTLSHIFFFPNSGKPPVKSETSQEWRFNPRALKQFDKCMVPFDYEEKWLDEVRQAGWVARAEAVTLGTWLCHEQNVWVQTGHSQIPSLGFPIYKPRLVHSHGSQTWVWVRIIWGTCLSKEYWVPPSVSDSIGLGWGAQICISNKFSGRVYAVGLGPHLENHWLGTSLSLTFQELW